MMTDSEKRSWFDRGMGWRRREDEPRIERHKADGLKEGWLPELLLGIVVLELLVAAAIAGWQIIRLAWRWHV